MKTHRLLSLLTIAATLLPCLPAYSQPSQIQLLGKNLFPEGIAYRAKTQTFYIGSAANGSVQTQTLKGKGQLIQKPNTDNRKKALGIKIDEVRKRLWVLDGNTGIYIYHLETNKLINKLSLENLFRVGAAALNDLVLDDQGNAYITDSFNPHILRVDSKNLTLMRWCTLDNIPFGKQNGMPYNLNGIVLSPDKKSLISVKTNDGSLWKIDLDDKTVSEIKLSEPLTKGDGLAWGPQKKLYIVRNFENKLSMIDFTKQESMKKVTTFSPSQVKTPTTAAFTGQYLAVVNSQFGAKKPVDPFTITLFNKADLNVFK